jgi:hypothetical protein
MVQRPIPMSTSPCSLASASGESVGFSPCRPVLESVPTAGALSGEAYSLCAFEVSSIFIAARHLHAVFAFGVASSPCGALLAWGLQNITKCPKR